MAPWTIAVDIGNTYARFGLIDCAKLICVKRLACPTAEVAEKAAEMITNLLADHRDLSDLQVNVSTVVHTRTSSLERQLRSFTEIASLIRVKAHTGLPLKFSYEFPNLLGADRIANALYAFKAYPGQDVCIVDAGTAVTVDYLTAAGDFAGGAILPGVVTQMQCLNKATAALPMVKTATAKPRFPGRSTEECINAGVIFGAAAAVSALVKLIKPADNRQLVVIVCGGEWPLIGPYVDFASVHIPDCTLIGAGLYEERI
jgi:type III pantothenate kinase